MARDRERPCTCHSDDNPPRPCPHMHAYSECVKAAEAARRFDEREHDYIDPTGYMRGDKPRQR